MHSYQYTSYARFYLKNKRCAVQFIFTSKINYEKCLEILINAIKTYRNKNIIKIIRIL